MHELTTISSASLYVFLRANDNTEAYAHYDYFKIGNSTTHYRLGASGYQGTAGNSLDIHDGMPFSTFDVAHPGREYSCASTYNGAWWYDNCYHSNLNGNMTCSITGWHGCATWTTFRNYNVLKYIEMRIIYY